MNFANWPAPLKWVAGILAVILVSTLGGFFGYYTLLLGAAVVSIVSFLWVPMVAVVLGAGVLRGYMVRKQGKSFPEVSRALGTGLAWGALVVAVLTIAAALYTIASGATGF